MKFVDLFAGLGGFHLALRDLSHECVFACDINSNLREIYYKNFGIYPKGDIRLIKETDIPSHDILCAGFPCQPFSKAGNQNGLDDKERGRLFYEILRIIKHHKPKYVILENVPQIRRHNDGRTWSKMEKLLKKEGYDVRCKDLSPHHFGIPQRRFRTYIVASKKSLCNFSWPDKSSKLKENSVKKVLEVKPHNIWNIPSRVSNCLEVWQEFLDIIPKDTKIPLPVWAMEFGSTYPYKKITPFVLPLKRLKYYKGSFGMPICGSNKRSALLSLPSHARRENKKFPDWKINMIDKNRKFYNKNKHRLRSWIKKIMTFPPSYQKLEWNCNGDPRNIMSCLVQFRASGVRVKRLDTAPTLVAMNLSQTPIVPWEKRYMTLKECKRLQSMDSLSCLPSSRKEAYKALGNAVNVDVVKLVTESLLSNEDPITR
jgi:DNA (cytosine-5)-methyltransferase 1